MSWAATNWARTQRTGTTNTKMILLLLADLADENHSCFPGQARLAADAEMHVNSVARHVTKLEALGLVRREARQDGRGHRTSDRYFLAVDGPFGPDTARTLPTTEVDRPNPPNEASLTTTQVGPNHHLGVEEPLENHQIGGGERESTEEPPQKVERDRRPDGAGWDEFGPTAPHCPEHPPWKPDTPCHRCPDYRQAFPEAARRRGAHQEKIARAERDKAAALEARRIEAERADPEAARAHAKKIRDGLRSMRTSPEDASLTT